MKLVFNKFGNGDQELKKYLGFIDKSIKFDNLERFVRNATHTLIDIIGKETYDIIWAFYDEGDTNDVNLSYVTALQDAISIEAYRRYVPSKDVGHTQNGRRMRVDDHEKQAFEWMIDRDNENMERTYYLSVDQLLNTLETLQSWKETDKYKKLNALFVSKTADFQEYFNIDNSRYLLIKLLPGLRQAERDGIIPRIGKEAATALKADSSNNEELIELIKEACVYWSLSWAMKGRLTVTLFPEGVLQRFVSDRTTTQGRKPPIGNEYAWASQEFKNDADNLLRKIEDLVAPEPIVVADEEEERHHFGFDENDNYVST